MIFPMVYVVALEDYLMGRMCPGRGSEGQTPHSYSGVSQESKPSGGMSDEEARNAADYILKNSVGTWESSRDIQDNPDRNDDGRVIEINQQTEVYMKYLENQKLYYDGKGIVLTVTGSRTYTNKDEFAKMIDELEKETGKKVVMIQQGGANGADSIARQFAFDNGISSRQFDADWSGKGLKAGVVRNSTMVKGLMENKYAGNEKIVMAIFDGHVTSGTADMLKKSMLAGIRTKDKGLTGKQYNNDFVIPYLGKYVGSKTGKGSLGSTLNQALYDEEADQ